MIYYLKLRLDNRRLDRVLAGKRSEGDSSARERC